MFNSVCFFTYFVDKLGKRDESCKIYVVIFFKNKASLGRGRVLLSLCT